MIYPPHPKLDLIIFIDIGFGDFIIVIAMTETCSNTYRYMEYHS